MALIYDRNNKDVVDVVCRIAKAVYGFRQSRRIPDLIIFQNYDDDYDRIAEDVLKDGNKIAYILGKSSGWRAWPKP